MKNTATVVAADGKFAVVETTRVSACEGCHKADAGGCSVCSLLGGEQKLQTRAKNAVSAEVGDTVTVESRTGRMILYAALLFLLPIFAAFVGYFVGAAFRLGETGAVSCALCAFAVGFLPCVLVSRRKNSRDPDVEITAILMKGKR